MYEGISVLNETLFLVTAKLDTQKNNLYHQAAKPGILVCKKKKKKSQEKNKGVYLTAFLVRYRTDTAKKKKENPLSLLLTFSPTSRHASSSDNP